MCYMNTTTIATDTDFASIIQTIEQTSSRNSKEDVLWDCIVADQLELFEAFHLAYNSFITFGVKKFPKISHQPEDFSTYHQNKANQWREFKILCSQLEKRQLSGNAALDAIEQFATQVHEQDWSQFYSRIISKDMKCGLSEKTVNKVLKTYIKENKKSCPADKIERLESLIIPTFDIQLAANSKDYPDLICGIKMIDGKHDGIRLLTFIDFEKQSVVHYTRNGKINENFVQITNEIVSNLDKIKTFLIDKGFDCTQGLVLDGEMISDNFQKLMTQVNRKTNVDTSDSLYQLFDLTTVKSFDTRQPFEMQQIDRRRLLSSLFDTVSFEKIKHLPYLMLNLDNDEDMEKYFEYMDYSVNELGLEGIMIKEPTGTYDFTRGKNWLKYKPEETFDLEVIEVLPGTGKNSHRLGSLVCQGFVDGVWVTSRGGGGFSDRQRDEFWEMREQLIGQIVEIKSDCITKDRDGNHSLRFPRFVRFRGCIETGKI